MYAITFTSITYIQVDFRRDLEILSQHHFSRPPNEDPVKIQRQAAREEEARIAKVVEFGVTKTNLFFLGVDQRMQIYGGFKGFACHNIFFCADNIMTPVAERWLVVVYFLNGHDTLR